MKNLGGTTLLLLLVFLSSTAMGAEVVTDAAEYPPLQTVIISGSGYVPDESVTLQVTQEDGTPLTGEYGEPWIVVADESGNISSTWTAPYPDQPDDTVMLTGSGSTSGEEGATTFLIAPQNYIHQLQNGTATAVPNWAGGVINSNNSCYSEGRAVPYRYFVENLDGGSQHYITIECEWTKGGLHGFDYFADYDFSESSGISAAGGTCGSISASPPPDCQPISGSYPFPDPTNSANYSSPIPPDFFPTGFVLNAPTNLSFYNMTVDSVSKYYFAGTSSDRTFGITIYFTAVDTGSVGLYWGGHMAQGTPDTWGIGNGSGSIAGAPIHMRAGVLDGSGGFKEISAQTGVICLPPDATISCSADSVCTDTVYSCSAPAGADDYIWSLTGGTILSGQGTETITYTVTQPYPGFVYIDLEACDTTSGCPGDNCCSYDSVELPVGYCCDPPVATCPGDTTIFACDLSQICLPGFDCNGTATVTGGTLSGNSVCFTPVEGLNTITFICTNDCGFADTCVTNVTVELNQAPVCSLPGDTAIFQCVPTEVSLPVSGTDPDGNLTGCSVIAGPGSIVGGYWQYTPAGDETVNVTVRCTDDCGAYCEASFSATFDINEPPVCNLPSNNTYFVCDDSTFSFPVSGTDADGNLTGCTMTSGVGTFDGSTWTFTATLEGVYSATFECQDDCGAVCGGTVDITVDFNAPPVITCPADINVDCNGSTDPANIGFATATDDHDPNPSITYSDSQSGNVITRTWTTTDDCGVSNQCDQLITIEDTTPPTITCPDAVSVQCPVDVPPADINSVTVSDDCDTNPVVTHVGDVSDNSSCPETITRTYRATDASGNYVECTQIITIDDTIAPVITCPADITLDCSDPTDPSFTGTATATDNCDPSPDITYSDTPNGGGFYRTWTATDDCGNFSQCIQTITIDDTTPPTITCPDAVSVQCPGDVPPADINSVTVSDDCDTNPVVTHVGDVSDNNSCPETITRTYRATDASGNYAECAQIITIDDTMAPLITCPADITIDCSGSTDPSNTGIATATDNCDQNIEITYTDSQTGNIITRTWTAVDDCNNSAQCDQIITIDDTTPPTIICLDAVSVQCFGDVPPVDIGSVTVSDDCDPSPVVTHVGDVSDNSSCPETITRTYRATDTSGNYVECTQIITIDDTIAPVITCPADITLDCSDPTDPSFTGTATATDNCDPSLDITYSDTPNGGGFHRTWTATDDCGNFSQCTQTITIDDTTPPTITCPDAFTVQCPGDVPPADIGSVTVSDDCDLNPVVTHVGDVSDNNSCPETITRTYRATDASGNYAECTQIITIDDTMAPLITCPADITIDCSGSTDPSNTGTATATDNCDQNLDITYTDSQTGNIITRTWTAVDDCNNSAQCDQIITIDDTTPPTIICLDAVSVQCFGDVPPVDIGSVTVSDDCDPSPVVTHVGDVSDNNSCPETITRTYRATDASGNYAECAQIITIDDTMAPVITCPADITVVCNNPSDPSNTGTATATDNCDQDIEITYTDSQTGNIITRTWTAVDDCGNSAQCDQLITLVPNSPPVCNVPNDTTIHQCNGDAICLPVSATDPDGNLENCQITSGPGTLQNGEWCYTTTGSGAVTVTITCTDSCGEFCEESFTVTFTVNNAPVLTVAADIDTFMCDASDQICFDNSASDADLPQDELHFEMPSAPAGAAIDQQTGQVCFVPGSSGTYSFTIRLYDGCDAYDEGTVTVMVTENQPPTISANQEEFFFAYCPDADAEEKCFNGFTVSDPDHSLSQLTISKIQGPGTFNPGTGSTCFTPDVMDSLYEFIYQVSDPCGAVDYDTIDVNVVVLDNCDSITCIDVALGDTACVYNSTYIYAPITISNYVPSIGGFELLITYDPSAFTFVGAVQGDAIAEWEYFTYRTGPFGNCGNNCPSGMILLVGIADVNNGAPHPSPSAYDPNGVLANLKFYVTDDRNFGGQSYPLRFFWMDCGNNMFSNEMGDTVYVDKRIYDPFGGIRWDEFDDVNFPESERPFGTGAPDVCVIGDKTVPIRCVQFFDGYISICHPDSIDLRGDMNMNEIPNEIGDAVLYTNYFIYGPGVFIINLYGQIAASDINADGKTLTVGDLVYLIRIMSGDAVAIPKLAPFSDETRVTLCTQNEGYTVTTNTSSDMAAILLSFAVDNQSSDIAVKLADNLGQFSIMSDIVNDRLNVLIYSFDRIRIPAGKNEIINIEAADALKLISAEASDYNGNQLDVILNKVEVPTEFALSQNYPNPFNPETEIMLSLPESGNWYLDIYNIRGQLVRQFSGYSGAGTVHIKWDSRDDRGNEAASGIYFYKARVDDRFSQTRKMILLK